jgi:NTP pyrophosphatase (non-canonical NTP hydrolase)
MEKFDDYQRESKQTAVFPEDQALHYLALGLSGEAGEVADKVKKTIRDNNGELDGVQMLALAKELGDVLWYLSQFANYLGYPLSEVAQMNRDKLTKRQQENKLGGSGDER